MLPIAGLIARLSKIRIMVALDGATGRRRYLLTFSYYARINLESDLMHHMLISVKDGQLCELFVLARAFFLKSLKSGNLVPLDGS